MHITLSGEIDLANAAAVEEEIHAAVSHPGSCSREHLGYTRCGSCWKGTGPAQRRHRITSRNRKRCR